MDYRTSHISELLPEILGQLRPTSVNTTGRAPVQPPIAHRREEGSLSTLLLKVDRAAQR